MPNSARDSQLNKVVYKGSMSSDAPLPQHHTLMSFDGLSWFTLVCVSPDRVRGDVMHLMEPCSDGSAFAVTVRLIHYRRVRSPQPLAHEQEL